MGLYSKGFEKKSNKFKLTKFTLIKGLSLKEFRFIS